MNKQLKYISKGICILTFLYILSFSIQNFYQGFHDLDTAQNFLRLGMVGDINTGGLEITLNATYLRGVDRMTSSFVWLTLNSIFGVAIGLFWRLK